jgi:hypothetical protein
VTLFVESFGTRIGPNGRLSSKSANGGAIGTFAVGFLEETFAQAQMVAVRKVGLKADEPAR